MQKSIKCFYPTQDMMKEAELLSNQGYNIDVIGVSVLHSLYSEKNNTQNNPSINDLKQLIEDNKKVLDSFKYAIPYYTVGASINNPKEVIVDNSVIEEKFILHTLPDNITIKDVLDTWTAVPNEYKAIIETKKDLYTVELWTSLLLKSGMAEYDIMDNPNAGLNAILNSITKLKEYKDILSKSTNKGYNEVESLKNNQLGGTHKDKNGNIVIDLKKYISVDEFFNYITGKIESPTSKQKQLVLNQMEKNGITLSMMKEKINTPEKVKEFLYLHELNHSMNYDDDIKNYNREDYSAQVNIDMETRANMYAWNEMFSNKSITAFTTSNSTNYPSRTKDNADWSDITLSLATNFSTRGEELTKKVAGNKYINSQIYGSNDDIKGIADNLYNQLKSKDKLSNIKLNIAGNGIYSLPEEQSYYNDLVTAILSELLNKGVTIKEVRSGGQTGIDEAGIIAAQRLNIPNSVRATSDFKFKDKSGKDIADEQAFKSRFMQNIETKSSVKYYVGNITPDTNTIFVFGSNPEGRHGAGAAKIAREQFGAIYGQGEGLQGNAYAIPTKRINNINPSKIGQMSFSYGNEKRSDITSATTFEAILNGERTATTRYESDGHISYWKDLKVGDIVGFRSADKKAIVYVRITKPLTKLDKSTSPEEWSKKEGWSIDYYNSKVKPNVDKGQAYQMEYTFIGAYGERTVTPNQIINSIKSLYNTARQNPNKQFKVAYRNTDTISLNGYTGLEMIDMFINAGPIPSNIVFSKEWVDTGKFEPQLNTKDNELPEVGKPFYNTESMMVDKESPRAILSREMSYVEIIDRANMIARDFSTVLDEEIDDLKEELEEEINSETNPLNKLKLSEKLAVLNDPIKGRREVINSLGIDTILDKIKERYQNWIDLSDEEINYVLKGNVASHVRESYEKVLNNFDILFDTASTTIESNEKLRIIRESSTAEESNKETTQEDLDGDEDGSKVHGNEGYTFKIRFVDPHESSRAETRKALSNIIQVDSNGNPILNDLGNTVYMREDFVHSTLLSILSNKLIEPDDFSIKDSEGNYHFPILEEMMPSYPWISQVINKLAYDPRLISIFYTDFRKEYVSYWMQRGNSIFPINSPVAFDSTVKNISSNYEQGNLQDDDSVFDVNLNINNNNIEKGIKLADSIISSLQKVYEDDMDDVASKVSKVLNMLGFSSLNIDIKSLANIDNLSNIRKILESAKDAFNLASNMKEGAHYLDTIKEPVFNIARLIGKVTELDAQTTFRQGSNSYPSYAAPNYIEKTFKYLLSDSKRQDFINREYAKYDWFKHNGEWSNEWLNLFENNQNIRDMFSIKNVFLINDIKYSDWDNPLITKSFLREYFAIKEDSNQTDQFAWYNFPIFSDTEMATFVKFKKYTGNFKEQMLPLYNKLVKQELRRIALVEERANKGIPSISNFDERGKEFCFLPELNGLVYEYEGQSFKFLNLIKQLQDAKNITKIDYYINKAITDIMDSYRRNFFNNHSDIFEDEELIKFIKDSTGLSTKEGIEDKIEEYIWNSMYATSQLIQLVTTDLAYYKNSVDFQKRFKEVYAAGTKLNTNSEYGRKEEKTVYISDNILTSPTYQPLNNILKEAYNQGRLSKMDYDSIMYKFRNINATDGQAYRSLSSYRAIMDMLGNWTPEMQKAFDNLSNNSWDISDINVVWQTIKPFVYSQVDTPDGLGNFIKVPHQNKNSEYLLLATYQVLGTVLNKSPQLRGINRFMEKYNIDVIQFESAVKVGASGIIDININPNSIKSARNNNVIINGTQYTIPNIEGLSDSKAYSKIKEYYDNKLSKEEVSQDSYNSLIEYFQPTEEQVYNILYTNTMTKVRDTDFIDESVYNLTTVHKLSYDDYMIAQPTPEHLFDVDSIFGSQTRNLLVSDLPDDIEITIEGKVFKGKDEVRKLYFSLIVENLLESYNNLNKDFLTIESLQKRLLSLVKGNPKYGRDMLNALEIIEYNGRKTFNIPFSDPIVSTKFQELLLSMFKNSITKQYINGASCILVSNFGFTNELEVVRKEDDSVEAIECYLPAYSKKMYKPFLKEVKNKAGKTVGFEIDYDKIKKEDKSLFDFIGYRIPTEGKYSMLPLRIKGFLPQQNGSAIMLPAEVTTLSGSDFDVDKLFMMLPSFKFNKIYNIKKAWDDFYEDPKNQDIKEEINSNMGEALNKFIKEQTEDWNEDVDANDIEDFTEEFKDWLKKEGIKNYQFSETAQSRFSKWFNSRKDNYFVKENISRIKYDNNKDVKDNSKQQRDNALIQIGLGILRNKNIGEDLQNPGNFDKLKHEARVSDIITNPSYLKDYINKYGIKYSNGDYTEVCKHLLNNSLDELDGFLKRVKKDDNTLTLDTFIKYHNQNMTGGVLIGIYANNTTMQAKFQGKNLGIKDGFEFTVNDRTIKSLTDVFTKEIVNGKAIDTKISKNCAQFSAASVDNVKDPVLASLMQNKNTANVACFMLRAGMSIPEIGTIFNIPIVRECIKNTSNIKALKAYISEYEKNIAALKGVDHYTVNASLDFNTLDIMNDTALFYDTEYLNSLSYEEKSSIYERITSYAKGFMYIASLANPLNNTVQAYRADSPNGAIGRSIALAKVQTMNIDRLIKNSRRDDFPIYGIEEVISNDYIDSNMSIDEIRNKLINSNMPLLQAFYSLGIDLGMKKMSEYFIEASPYVSSIIDEIQYNYNTPITSKTIESIYKAVLQFSLSNTELFGNDPNMSLEEKRSYYINEFPNEFNRIVHRNSDIAELPFIQKLKANTFNGIIMKDSAINTPYLRELLMNSADALLYMDNPEAQKLAIDLLRYGYYKESFRFGHNTFSQHFSTVFKNAFPDYVNTIRDLQMTIGNDSRWDRLISQIYANNPSFAPIINVDTNSYTDDTHTTINISSSAVANPNSRGLQPYKYIQDMEDNLFKLNESTAGNEVVTYNKINTFSEGNLYDINKDVNDMITEYNYHSSKYSNKKNTDKANSKLEDSNDNYEYMSIEDSGLSDYLVDFNPAQFNAEFNEAKRIQEEKYSAEDGLKEEGIKPCSSNGNNVVRKL